jgi:hypothetical protein
MIQKSTLPARQQKIAQNLPLFVPLFGKKKIDNIQYYQVAVIVLATSNYADKW